MAEHITEAIMYFIFVVEIYLISTNVPYVMFKLRYYLPPLLKYNRTAKRFRYLAEVSRTCYLFFVTGWTAKTVFYGNIFQEDTAHWPCSSFFRLPILYYYFVLNFRVLFAFSRLLLFKLCVDKPYWNETVGFIVTLSLMLFVFILMQIMLKRKVEEQFCFSVLSTRLTIIVFLMLFTYELMSFFLYYKPLQDADGISTKHLSMGSELFSCRDKEAGGGNFEKDLSHSKSFKSLSVSSSSSLTTTLTFELSSSNVGLVKRFHKIVRRNFWAGITTIFAGTFAYTVFILFHCTKSLSASLHISSETRVMYFQSGVGEVVDKTLALIMYITMILTENNWRRALIPFCFWQKEVWDV